jgi:hypothetical protein
MEPTTKRFPTLAEIECEVAAEGRQWMQQRLQERLQQLANEQGEVFPPPATPAAKAHPSQRTRRGQADR